MALCGIFDLKQKT